MLICAINHCCTAKAIQIKINLGHLKAFLILSFTKTVSSCNSARHTNSVNYYVSVLKY